MTSFWKKSLIITPSLVLLGFASQAHATSQDYRVKISEQLTYSDNYLSRTTAEQNHQTTFVIPQNVLQSLNEQKNSPTPRPVFFNHTSGSLAQYVEDLTSPQENKSLPLELVTFIEKNIKPNLTESQPQNAIWREEKGRVVEFNSGSIGKSFDTLDLAYAIIAGVKLGQNEIVFNPVLVNPQTTLSSLNSYGIESLVARGVSNFSGSSRNRITNIRTGSSRYNGLIIPAGETFSFNDQLGPIDGKHGFAPEIVIKGKDLIPEFGGGLCQVSTTFFRAALNAGFPVVERHNHAFAVAYYSPSGTDATIYTGVIDLRVKNDTGSPVMIWT
ncbi:MAG TPA: VanW family protein, partial [Flavobacterium sp.]|nr:VanW family protein [Flavobacterium sp.]